MDLPSADVRPDTPGSRAAIAFIFVTVVLDTLALGIIIPVLPMLVRGFLGGSTTRAAEVFGLFGTVWALMQFLFSPVLGAFSDRFGRRWIILVSCFGLGIDYIFMAVAPTLTLLFIGRVISGITAASFGTAAAYVADITPPEKRAGAFGIVGAGWGTGFVLGPALGGLLGGSDPRLPFLVAAGLSIASALYGIFVLPESLPPDRRKPFSWQRANPLGSLHLLKSHPGLLGLASVNALYYMAHHVLSSVFVLYAAYRYGWETRMVGVTLASVGICNVIVQGGLVKPLVNRFMERRMLLIGLVFGAAGFILYGLATTGPMFLIGVPVFAFMGLYGPSAQGLMTRRVHPNEQGQLQGANSSIMGITGIIGPALFTQTFAYCISERSLWHLPGAPFFLAALLLVVAMVIAWNVTKSDG